MSAKIKNRWCSTKIGPLFGLFYVYICASLRCGDWQLNYKLLITQATPTSSLHLSTSASVSLCSHSSFQWRHADQVNLFSKPVSSLM